MKVIIYLPPESMAKWPALLASYWHFSKKPHVADSRYVYSHIANSLCSLLHIDLSRPVRTRGNALPDFVPDTSQACGTMANSKFVPWIPADTRFGRQSSRTQYGAVRLDLLHESLGASAYTRIAGEVVIDALSTGTWGCTPRVLAYEFAESGMSASGFMEPASETTHIRTMARVGFTS